MSEGPMDDLLLDEHPRGGSGRGIDVAIDLSEARDQELIRRVRRGDEDAFRRFFRRYAPSALSLARRVVQQPFLAEEIVQEAFLAVWRNPDRYDPRRGSVRAWLMGTVHHRAVDAVRLEESQRRRAEDPAGVRIVGRETDGCIVDLDTAVEPSAAWRELLFRGWPIKEIVQAGGGLENLYLSLTERRVA